MNRRARWWGLGLLLVLLWLVVYPLCLVVVESFRGPDGWTGAFFARFVQRPNEWKALWGSVWISGATVVLSGLIGVPLAFLFARYEFPGRRLLGALVALPVVLPPLVGVIAFLFLFGETGFAARLVQAILGTTDPPWRLQGAGAILLVHAYSMYVYFYLFTRAGLAGLDPSLLEAAAALGAGRRRTLLRVTLPLLRAALTGAAILTFLTSLASFSAPYIFGGGFRVMTTQIVATRLNGDVAMAMVETISLTLVALVGLWLLRRSEGGELSGGRKGSAPIRTAVDGSRRILLSIAATALTVILLLPHFTLILLSFVPVGTWTTEAIPPAYTVGNYVALLSEPERFRPLFNSLWMATLAMVAAMIIAVMAGHLVVRRRTPGGRTIEWLLSLPWAVPGTVFAIALATMFAVQAPWAGRVVLIGTLWLLPLAYLVRNLPMAGRAVVAGYRQLDPSMEEAAASLGAGRWRTLRRVTLPLLKPALAAGATLAFATGLGDFVTSIMLYTYDTRPISLEILSSMRNSDIGIAAAYGVFLMVISALVFALGSERKTATG
ncbi:MAG: iron ABC transporter permease [Gemmatimonadota bacterium]